MLHRASMKAYQDCLEEAGYRVMYLTFQEDWRSRVRGHRLFAAEVYDRKLEGELPDVTFSGSPAFLGGELKKSGRYVMGHFYKSQRKRLGILIRDGKPTGGKWSFDADNRKPLPRGHLPPAVHPAKNRYIEEAAEYVLRHFADNPGDTENFVYPVTFEDSRKWLKTFIRERLENFGDYEDAISEKRSFLYHSVLSPLLNIGLLTPKEIIEKVLEAEIPLNSKEGFIRQVIGWREFILQIYLMEGEKQRASNYFGHTEPIPESFYSASTGIPPVDNVIRKVLDTAYSHHIERLMVLGNYMLLNGYSPDAIYRWFMEMYIDAYDWVMVPNVYGMSQYADGGLMATKPYISSSKYILRMSDFEKGDWCRVWDGLFWDFLKKHRDKFLNNPRMTLMMRNLKIR
jgi:deoxyribodipyrimidine photolyase-related protein